MSNTIYGDRLEELEDSLNESISISLEGKLEEQLSKIIGNRRKIDQKLKSWNIIMGMDQILNREMKTTILDRKYHLITKIKPIIDKKKYASNV